jgi:hypothetical protein
VSKQASEVRTKAQEGGNERFREDANAARFASFPSITFPLCTNQLSQSGALPLYHLSQRCSSPSFLRILIIISFLKIKMKKNSVSLLTASTSYSSLHSTSPVPPSFYPLYPRSIRSGSAIEAREGSSWLPPSATSKETLHQGTVSLELKP